MLLLELFSGTGSVGKAFRAKGWEVFSVDLDAGCNPTLAADVLHLRTEQLPNSVDLIWASPPCTHYSCARTKAKTPRDLEGSDALVRKVLELVAHYQHVDFFMENPHSGLLKSREVVAGIPMQIVDYCKYGKPYRKRTSIWTDSGWVPQRPLCKHDCPASVGGTRHAARAQQGPARKEAPRFSRDELYSIPAAPARR
jgi:site-specific DNA-cytosine methylase